ncbi:hypothetical protein BD311DRAFT_112153 [Dichomitus squalens]|uniref:Uncharacterized protein n=1 Tax=Dichomitus squalens TaxID=114155 RepID=A0A4V2JYY4_9APHY|nr:hypothetical protein BD311DRAFT_112153 [Dichomitus squalens]
MSEVATRMLGPLHHEGVTKPTRLSRWSDLVDFTDRIPIQRLMAIYTVTDPLLLRIIAHDMTPFIAKLIRLCLAIMSQLDSVRLLHEDESFNDTIITYEQSQLCSRVQILHNDYASSIVHLEDAYDISSQ